MEQNTPSPSPEYTKGFNEGYLLNKHMPDLADELSKYVNDSERGNGFKDGRDEYAIEKNKQRYPSFLNKDRNELREKDMQHDEKEKDHGEIEREKE